MGSPQSLFLRFWWSCLTFCSHGKSSVARYPPFGLFTCKEWFWCRTLASVLLSHARSTQMWSSLYLTDDRVVVLVSLPAGQLRADLQACATSALLDHALRSKWVRRTIKNDCLADSCFKLIYLINRKSASPYIIRLTDQNTHTISNTNQYIRYIRLNSQN